MDKSWGQIAYEAYVEHCGGQGINGDRLPSWDSQNAAIQAHWDAAGLAVTRQYRLEALADAAYIAEHGGDDLETGHLRDPEGDEAAHG